ncbi:hypothetical protein [Methylomonas methanica]|uniref:Secreted protein with PEP-CTERM sorting signal n=1 Tax=Methylomonas methanica (strain DSM 25384 / MC09) TaxID=857087 RepID=F9ZW82_METMM|nr:hypothetical protein [Methylomonas methanica]AEG02053.1 hypothetical protein Metme_3695 [Methylomonas methanica MC09]
MKKALITASLGLALFLPQAEAQLFDFSYTDAAHGITLSGTINGVLEADNNTVAVTSFQDVAFNGAAGTPTSLIYNADHIFSTLYPTRDPIQPGFPDSTTPLVTLNGSYMNLAACVDAQCLDGFFFLNGNSLASMFFPAYMAGPSYGQTMDSYVQAGWQMSAVPIPGSVWMLISGCVGILGVNRRKQQG